MQSLKSRWTGFTLAVMLLALAAGCNPQVNYTPISQVETLPGITLTPYIQNSKTPDLESSPEGTITPLPSPSPTPIIHTVTVGETFGTIAMKYGITVDSLIIANPTVNPNAIPVGTVLNIPAAPAEGSPANVLPTPIPLILQPPSCYQDVASRIICFLDAFNQSTSPVEGASAVLRYQSSDGSLKETVAYSMLNRIPASGTVPLYAMFPADKNWNGSMSSELRSAIPALADNSLVEISVYSTEISADGTSARVTGIVSTGNGGGEYWVLLVGRNGQGQITTARRFTVVTSAGEASTNFTFQIFSMKEKIASVEVLAEPAP